MGPSLPNKISRPAKVPRPLTRRTREGIPYARDPDVQRQIDVALSLDPTDLIARAQVSSPESDDFLREECIVSVIREYLAAGDDATVNALFDDLLSRGGRFIHSRFRALDRDLARDAYDEILGQMAEAIFDLESESGDYLQVRFFHRLKTLCIDEFRKRTNRQEVEKLDRLDEGEVAGGGVSGTPAAEPPGSTDDWEACREALAVLPQPLRELFVLRHYHGWSVDSRDPGDVTLSTRYGVIGRRAEPLAGSAPVSPLRRVGPRTR
jgi:DNA-directed RNA polymerase specialized sigma24 family protein